MICVRNSRFLVVTLILLVCLSPKATPSTSSADLTITSSTDTKKAKLDDDVVYTVTVTNQGPEAATNVELDLGMHDQFNPVSLTCSEGSTGGRNCTVLTLAAGSSFTAVLVANVCCFPKGETRQAHLYAHVHCDNDPNDTNNYTDAVIRITGGWEK